jgi:hypothetical protein
MFFVQGIILDYLRNEFIFLFGDGVSPEKKNEGKLRHCA